MKRTLPAVLLLILSANFLFSQTQYDLSQYKLPDLRRQTLDLSFDLSSALGNYKSSQSYMFLDESKSVSDRLNLDAKYSRTKNNWRTQRSTDIRLRYNMNSSNLSSNRTSYYGSDGIFTSKSNMDHTSTLIAISSRWYNKKRMFVELGINSDFEFDARSQTFEREQYETKERRKESDISSLIEIPLKLGIGRVEEVQDARHAIYILDELSKVNQAKPEYSDEEITALAEYISQVKNERYFDNRIERIENLKAVDSFLVANNYCSGSNIDYFTTLNDFWKYGGIQVRKSGTRLSLAGFTILESFNYDDETYEQYKELEISNMTIKSNFIFGPELIYENPFKLNWQQSLSAGAYINKAHVFYYKDTITSDEISQFDTDFNLNYYLFRLKEELAFYPNTRTSAVFYAIFDFRKYTDLEVNPILKMHESGALARSSAGLDISYYITPKFRLYFTYSFNHYWLQNSSSSLTDKSDRDLDDILLSARDLDVEDAQFHYSNAIDISLTYSIF